MHWSIRTAERDDIAAMQRVELDAGARFRDIGLDGIADDEPPTTGVLAAHVDDGTAWVAATAAQVIGYAIACTIDGHGHLEQVSVMSDAGGQGVGRALVDAVHGWAGDEGYGSVTLTTFADVAWNGPVYRRWGYVELRPDQLGPQLAAVREAERAAGLDIIPRIAMRIELTALRPGRVASAP